MYSRNESIICGPIYSNRPAIKSHVDGDQRMNTKIVKKYLFYYMLILFCLENLCMI